MKRIQCISFAIALAVLMPGCDNPASVQGQDTGNIIRNDSSVQVSELCRVLLSMGCEVGKLYKVNGKYVTSKNGSIKTAEDCQIVIQESFCDSGNRQGNTYRNGVTVRYDISWTTQKYELWFCGKPYICDKTDSDLSNITYEKYDSGWTFSYDKASGILSQTNGPKRGSLDGKTISDNNAALIIKELCEPGDLAIMSVDTSRGYDDLVPGPFELRVSI